MNEKDFHCAIHAMHDDRDGNHGDLRIEGRETEYPSRSDGIERYRKHFL